MLQPDKYGSPCLDDALCSDSKKTGKTSLGNVEDASLSPYTEICTSDGVNTCQSVHSHSKEGKTMYRCFWIGVLSLVLLGSQSDAIAEQLSSEKRLLGVDDFDRTIDVSSPRLSPDGKQTVYQSAGKIYMVPTRGGISRVITSSASEASEPRWSADGKTLYFLSNRSGSSQLWKLPMETFGEAVQLTEFDFPLTTIDLSPDETRLLFSKQEPWKNKDEEGKTEPWVIDRLQFKEDSGDGYITGDTPNHYFIYDLDKKSTTQVTSGDHSESEAAWSPDGESIAYISNREIEPAKR
jgi:Tol biopolymer transport system component